MKKIVAAQIGCGKFAWAQDLPNLSKHPDVFFKWCCDVNPAQAAKAAAKAGIVFSGINFETPLCAQNFFIIANSLC